MAEGARGHATPAVRYLLWTSGGVKQAVGDPPQTAAEVEFLVELSSMSRDVYLVTGLVGAPNTGFDARVDPSGALVVVNAENDDTVRIYAPGTWTELHPNFDEWTPSDGR
jgi:hypothetical protein